jgi:hypothetical protein
LSRAVFKEECEVCWEETESEPTAICDACELRRHREQERLESIAMAGAFAQGQWQAAYEVAEPCIRRVFDLTAPDSMEEDQLAEALGALGEMWMVQ